MVKLEENKRGTRSVFRVVLPSSIIKSMGWGKGDKIEVIGEGSSVILEKQEAELQ
jgi:bifunctional DNA-binding transcriptional regulator/antitoxin component of YhaV-PrlF toxin-antitoxin module